MNIRITTNYAVSFFAAALFLVLVNILYMQSSVYKNDDLYHFDSEPYYDMIISGISSLGNDELEIDDDLKSYLTDEGIGIQILDERLEEVLRVNSPSEVVSNTYSAESLIALYRSDVTTTFVREVETSGGFYTILMFMDPDSISRRIYTYDQETVNLAYNPLWLISMNVMLLLLISYMYSYSISKPIHRINTSIIGLSEGDYDVNDPGKGIYKKVETAIKELAVQLETAKRERAQAEASREEWISNLSHDIKTPLTSVIGYGELLGDPTDKHTEDEIISYGTIIVDKGRYIETLLEDLNLTTRLKHNQLPLRLEKTEMVSEVKNILINILNDAPEGKHASFTYSDTPVYLSIDRRLFKRVVLNLVNNAFVHNEGPIHVKVHIDSDSSSVIMTFEDDGLGIRDEELDKIFERYYRGSHTETKTEGTGLGLAIARNIIEAHSGQIKAERSESGGLKISIEIKRITDDTY